MESFPHPGQTPPSAADRRRDARHAASGKVRLKLDGTPKREIELDLIDVSLSGFRASHRHGLLPLGADAFFWHPEASGKARIVWNWMFPDHVETGFVIVR